MGKVAIQVPDECEHEASNHGLEHQRLIRQESTNEAENESQRNNHEHHARQDRQQLHEKRRQ